MATYTATISWTRPAPEADFLKGKYSRLHDWAFDGGVTIKGSPSPHVVPKPWSDASAVDPEEAFVASLSSCHMLTFLWLAGKAGYVVDSYRDTAEGVMGKNAEGRIAVLKVTLRPHIVFSGDKRPDAAAHDAIHHAAHDDCFIANSVKTRWPVNRQSVEPHRSCATLFAVR